MNRLADPITTGAAAELPSWSERNQAWLVAAIARLRERLGAHGGEFAPVVADSVAADDPPDFTPALLHCARVFGLSAFERELLLLVAGLDLDPGLRSTVSQLQAGATSRASFGLALAVLTQPHWDALSPDAPLRYWQLVELEAGAAATQATLRLDERMLHFIAGVAASDTRLHGIARHIETQSAAADLPLAARIADVLPAADSEAVVADSEAVVAHSEAVVVLHAEPPDACAVRDLGRAIAACAARPAMWVCAQDLPAEANEICAIARRIDREAALSASLLLLEAGSAESAALALVGRLQSAVLWLGAPTAALSALPQPRRVLRFELPPPDAMSVRDALVTRCAPAAADHALRAALERAATQFHLGPAALDDVFERLRIAPPGERLEAVWTVARDAARGGLDALAQRIETRAGFDDLVLPEAQLGALRDIARQLRHRERVYREWGFGDKQPRGQGLTALFAGESGTGKTLAAEAIANETELDLYRVDLATLVSKYIGETEKNLKRLFDAAQASGAVLLFDEADALFGKRSEVKDSHDRYANIEVAYLLQRIECYRGLAILTTNMKSSLDRAFLRRIRFVVNFPFPDAAAREQIWRRQFPPRAPLGAIDYKALARMNLLGGHIRSIAVNAAFKAADAGQPIDQRLLAEAARAEYAKLERSFNDLTGSMA